MYFQIQFTKFRKYTPVKEIYEAQDIIYTLGSMTFFTIAASVFFDDLLLSIFEELMPTVHLIVRGKVQGVFYRATARDMAMNFGCTGWVKNTEAGEVELMVSGSQEQLDQFIHWCRRGPRAAKVTDVVITPAADQSFENFQILRER